jgi:hypothetical protein
MTISRFSLVYLYRYELVPTNRQNDFVGRKSFYPEIDLSFTGPKPVSENTLLVAATASRKTSHETFVLKFSWPLSNV